MNPLYNNCDTGDSPRGQRRSSRDGLPAKPECCDACGAIFERQKLSDLRVRTLSPIRQLDPGRCEPAEYTAVCPDCGAKDSFQAPIRCAVCGTYPCCCLLDFEQTPQAAGTMHRSPTIR